MTNVDRSKFFRGIAAEIDVWMPKGLEDLTEQAQEDVISKVELILFSGVEALQAKLKDNFPDMILEFDL